MSLRTLLGAREPLLTEVPEAAHVVELESFFLFPDALAGLPLTPLDAAFDEDEGLEAACARLGDEAQAAVEAGAELLLVTDERAGPERAPIPALLATGAVHHRLVAAGLRTRASLIVASDEPRETHHFATLLGYGADAICPRLALETVAALAAADKLGGDHPSPAEAQHRFRHAVEDGVLKVMSKMGISDVASYRGAQIFEALGLAQEVVDRCFVGTPCALGGVGFAELEREALDRLRAAYDEAPRLENPGYVKYRKGGEPHATTPEVVQSLQDVGAAHALRKAVNGGGWQLYERFAELVDGRGTLEPRDLLEPVAAGPPVPLDEVEPVEAIVRRFSGGAMSHGALSSEAHELVAVALNRIGARANTGEGGEDPDRYRTERNSPIKQVASGRFGVTPEYAAFAEELQIKVAQGSKPGEGGQLPGHKVTEEIARLRHTQPGVALISPPPHHDIYSIEDLAQLIFDLRQVNPQAHVSVKLVAEAGVGLVAAGVREGARGRRPRRGQRRRHGGEPALVDQERRRALGARAGRGAAGARGRRSAGPGEAPRGRRDEDGPRRARRRAPRRGRGQLRHCPPPRGGLPDGADVPPGHVPGRHRDPEARAAREVRRDAGDGRELPAPRRRGRQAAPGGARSPLARRRRSAGSTSSGRGGPEIRAPTCSTFRPLLGSAGDGPTAHDGEERPRAGGWQLGAKLDADASLALEEARLVELRYEIGNGDRTVGARLGGAIGRAFGSDPPPGRVRVSFDGVAGQSFGAFLAAGVKFTLTGEANDYVGKGMSGGRIAIRPPEHDAGDPCLIGNTALYGATGGELYCAGSAGERFAVRNSGAVAVVEGTGEHPCEYMTARHGRRARRPGAEPRGGNDRRRGVRVRPGRPAGAPAERRARRLSQPSPGAPDRPPRAGRAPSALHRVVQSGRAARHVGGRFGQLQAGRSEGRGRTPAEPRGRERDAGLTCEATRVSAE